MRLGRDARLARWFAYRTSVRDPALASSPGRVTLTLSQWGARNATVSLNLRRALEHGVRVQILEEVKQEPFSPLNVTCGSMPRCESSLIGPAALSPASRRLRLAPSWLARSAKASRERRRHARRCPRVRHRPRPRFWYWSKMMPRIAPPPSGWSHHVPRKDSQDSMSVGPAP